MGSLNLSVKYRPVKIAFLVREGSIDDLVKASGINTLLWGGIHNPIISVTEDKKFAEGLIDLFSPDILIPIRHTSEIDDLINQYPFLTDPGHGGDIFYRDWRTKKNLIGYLDSRNIVNYYWEHEFKHKPENYKSNCVLIRWEDNDDLKNLFSILFGHFPKDYNLKKDYENAFIKGLYSTEIKISLADALPIELAELICPLSFTSEKLQGYAGRPWRSGDGVYVGDANNFTDLVYFWNIRASGFAVQFLPKDKINRFIGFISSFIQILDKIPNRDPDIKDNLTVYHRDRAAFQEINDIIRQFKAKKSFFFYFLDEISWNGLNLLPATFHFGWEQVLANSDKSYGRYTVSVSFPEKKFLVTDDRDPDVVFQHLAISIEPLTEFEYPEHTLSLPFFRKLNDFYSREIAFDPWKIRIEREGVTEIINVHDATTSLRPISHTTLLQKMFEIRGIKSELSQPGLLTRRIIEKLNGIDGGRVFTIGGVRKLLQTLSPDDSISRGQATQIIWDNGKFKKHQKLYLEARNKAEVTTHDVFDFLLQKDFFRAGLEFLCNHCKLKSWHSLAELGDIWRCQYCGDENKTSPQLKNRGDWRFRKSGLFSKDNNQEGAIPVILTLLAFLRIFRSSKFIYLPSLELQLEAKPCETDFCIFQYSRGERIQLGIGECKSGGGAIEDRDIENLKMVRSRMTPLDLDCYLVFSKTAEGFTQNEIELFYKLQKENIPIILLANRELESPYPDWSMEQSKKVPEEYVHDMRGLSRNSTFLYLK